MCCFRREPRDFQKTLLLTLLKSLPSIALCSAEKSESCPADSLN